MATLLSALATDFLSLLVLWGLMGAAQAGAFPCAAKALGRIFPETERARATGLLASGMTIGGAMAPVLTAMFLESLTPWADDITHRSLATAARRLCDPGHLLDGRVSLDDFAAKTPRDGNHDTTFEPASTGRECCRSWPLALLCGQQFFRAAGMVFFMTWFPTFLQKTRDVSLLGSGILTTVAGIGGVRRQPDRRLSSQTGCCSEPATRG